MKDLKKKYLYLVAFINGVVVLIIEISGTKIIAPLYGSTIYVWTSLIVITMGALSLGYIVGGKLADKTLDTDYLFRVILLAGLYILLIPKIANPVLLATDDFGLKYGPLVSTLLIFFTPLFFLGMVSPFTIRLNLKSVSGAGKESGKVFGLSTMGSLVGGLLSGFYLAPIMSPKTLIFLSGSLLIMTFIIWQIFKNYEK